MGLINHAYSSHIQKGSDQSILGIGCDNPPTEAIPAGFVTFTVRFENVKWCKTRTVRAITVGLINHAYCSHVQKVSDQSILGIGSDNPPTKAIPAGFVTFTVRFENVKMVQNEIGKSDFGGFE